MSYMRARSRRMRKRPQGHGRFVPMGDDASTIDPTTGLPQYCSPLDVDYFQGPGATGQNGVPDYATALQTCTAGQAPGTTSACAQQATADAQKFIGVSSDLKSNWNPTTDDFAPADVAKIVSQMRLLSSTAASTFDAGLASIGTSDAARSVMQDFDDMLGAINDQATNYQNAVNAAQKSGAKAVHAPGLKDWVTSSLDTFAQATYNGSFIACDQPWWAGALQTVFGIASVVGSVCKAVASIALALGEKAVTAVEGSLDMVAMIEKIAPFAAIGLAAWWLFLREKKRGEKSFAL